MSHHSNLRILLSSCLLIPVFASAQTPRPVTNSDIIKMIQGHLPEVVIVNKIKASLATLDTSADALIALSKAGATEAELAAMTAVPAPAPIFLAAPAQQQSIEVAGGVLRRSRSGDPFIQFPEPRTTVFANGELSNRAWLVSFEGQPAIRVPGEHVDDSNTDGNLIITRDRVIFDPYLVEFGWGFYPKKGKYVLSPKVWQGMRKDSFFSMPRSEVRLDYINIEHSTASISPSYPSTRATIFTKGKRSYNIGFHFVGEMGYYPQAPNNICAKSEDCLSPQLEAFVRNLIRNFDQTIEPFLAAAAITDADKQLSADAHYRLTTEADLPRFAAQYQAQIDQLPPPTKSGGGFFAGLGEALQIAAAGATALQQSNAGGNTIAAQQSAMAQYNQSVAAIESGEAPTPAPYVPPPAAPAPAPAAPAPKPAAKSVFKFNQHPAKPAATPAATTVAAAKPAPAPTPAPASTGTVAPPSCVYLGTSPGLGCVSLANWQQIQSAPETIMPPTTGATGPAQIYYIVNSDIPVGPGVHWCPKSGHIHTGHYDLSGKFTGQDSPCTVGYHVRITWPAGTGITPVSIQ